MKVNNSEVSIEDLAKIADIDNIILKRRNNGLLLSDYQISVLERFNINYLNFSDFRSLMYDIESILNDDYDDELDFVGSQIAELIYYKDTKKWDIIKYHIFLFDYIFLDIYLVLYLFF